MSARPAFASSSTYTPCSQFVGGVNPWDPSMPAPAPVTAHLGSSPFVAPGTKAAAHLAAAPASARTSAPAATKDASAVKRKPGPKPGTARNQPRIDVAKLKIRKGVPLPSARKVMNKYAPLFGEMKPKDMIECPSEDVNPIDQALRKYLRDTGKDKTFAVVRAQTLDGHTDVGGVWLWPKDEIDSAKSPGSIAGRTTAARKSAK